MTILLKVSFRRKLRGEEMQMDDLIREWWHDPNSFKIIGDQTYHVPRLKKPPC
jgi:hypothetical protein